MIIAVSALIGFAIGLVAGYMLATLGTTNQKAGVLSDKKDCGVETEGISQSVKVLAPFGVSYQETSSSTNYSSSTVRVTGDTFVTPYGSVYHSRRNCGKLKAAKTMWINIYHFRPCLLVENYSNRVHAMAWMNRVISRLLVPRKS